SGSPGAGSLHDTRAPALAVAKFCLANPVLLGHPQSITMSIPRRRPVMTDTHDLVLAQLEALPREVQQLRGEGAARRRGRRTAQLGALCLALLTIAATGLWLPSSEVLAQRPDDPRLPPPKKDGAPQPPGQHLVVQSLKIVGADGKDRLSLGYDDI